jgi:transcriptional regulator with XRE-family HTH domain
MYGSVMNVVRELRYQAGLTQELLAKAAGTHSQTISLYEVGRTSPTWRMLLRLADAVGLELIVSFAPKQTATDDGVHRVGGGPLTSMIGGDPQALGDRSRFFSLLPGTHPAGADSRSR